MQTSLLGIELILLNLILGGVGRKRAAYRRGDEQRWGSNVLREASFMTGTSRGSIWLMLFWAEV